MKKLTLNETWKQCLRMWKWIVKEYIKPTNDFSISDLKGSWLYKHNFCDVESNCFFCEYASYYEGLPCSHCPGKLINNKFHCTNSMYQFFYKPVKFYQKLLELNKQRLLRRTNNESMGN